MEDSLIKVILDNNLVQLKDYCEKNITKHVNNRISDAKIKVLAGINNVSVEQMAEQMAVAASQDSK